MQERRSTASRTIEVGKDGDDPRSGGMRHETYLRLLRYALMHALDM